MYKFTEHLLLISLVKSFYFRGKSINYFVTLLPGLLPYSPWVMEGNASV